MHICCRLWRLVWQCSIHVSISTIHKPGHWAAISWWTGVCANNTQFWKRMLFVNKPVIFRTVVFFRKSYFPYDHMKDFILKLISGILLNAHKTIPPLSLTHLETVCKCQICFFACNILKETWLSYAKEQKSFICNQFRTWHLWYFLSSCFWWCLLFDILLQNCTVWTNDDQDMLFHCLANGHLPFKLVLYCHAFEINTIISSFVKIWSSPVLISFFDSFNVAFKKSFDWLVLSSLFDSLIKAGFKFTACLGFVGNKYLFSQCLSRWYRQVFSSYEKLIPWADVYFRQTHNRQWNYMSRATLWQHQWYVDTEKYVTYSFQRRYLCYLKAAIPVEWEDLGSVINNLALSWLPALVVKRDTQCLTKWSVECQGSPSYWSQCSYSTVERLVPVAYL